MSIIDKNIRLSTAQSMASFGTGMNLSTDDIDFAAARDMWAGKPLHFIFSPGTQITSGGAATIDFQVLASSKPMKVADGTAVTVTSAAPGVFTLASHGMVAGTEFYLASGTAPTGLTNGTVYYASNITTNTFTASTTLANALAGTAITTSSTGTSVTISQYTVKIASTGAVPIAVITPSAEAQLFRPVVLTPDTAIGALGLRSAILTASASGGTMRYARVNYQVATAALTAGTINCDIVDNVADAHKFYPTGSPF